MTHKACIAQLAIDFSCAARRDDPMTSVEAADRVKEFAHRHHAVILESLATQGPGTIYDIAERTGIDHVAVARRMSELEELRVAECTGEKLPGPTGRNCRVWRAA